MLTSVRENLQPCGPCPFPVGARAPRQPHQSFCAVSLATPASPVGPSHRASGRRSAGGERLPSLGDNTQRVCPEALLSPSSCSVKVTRHCQNPLPGSRTGRVGIQGVLTFRNGPQGPGAEAKRLEFTGSSTIIRSQGRRPTVVPAVTTPPCTLAAWGSLAGQETTPLSRDDGLQRAQHSPVLGSRLCFKSSFLTVFSVRASHEAEKYNNLCKYVSHLDEILKAYYQGVDEVGKSRWDFSSGLPLRFCSPASAVHLDPSPPPSLFFNKNVEGSFFPPCVGQIASICLVSTLGRCFGHIYKENKKLQP